MRYVVSQLAALIVASPVLAAEPSGCDALKWPLNKEQQLLAAAQPIEESAELDRGASQAVSLKLLPLDGAKLPLAPESRHNQPLAGYVRFGKASSAHVYKVTLSDEAWIDVVQDGQFLKSIAFTAVTGCPHVRKSVTFEIGPAPFTVQMSNAPVAAIAIVVTPTD
jgi:hypothetical protein